MRSIRIGAYCFPALEILFSHNVEMILQLERSSMFRVRGCYRPKMCYLWWKSPSVRRTEEKSVMGALHPDQISLDPIGCIAPKILFFDKFPQAKFFCLVLMAEFVLRACFSKHPQLPSFLFAFPPSSSDYKHGNPKSIYNVINYALDVV